MKRVSPFDARGYYYYYGGSGAAPARAGALGAFSVLSLSPLAYWVPNASVSSGTVADLSGNGYDLVQATSGQRPTFSASPDRLTFDGSDDNLQIPFAVSGAVSGGNAISLVMGYKGAALNSGIRLQPAASEYIILGYDGGSGPVFAVQTDGGVASGVSIAGVEDDAWHQIVGTWERNTVNGFRVYVDGSVSAQKNSADVALPILTDIHAAAIGAYMGSGSPTELMTGDWNHAIVLDRVLTSTEVATLYGWFQGRL